MKKTLIAIGILVALIAGYAGYNLYASNKIDNLLQEQEQSFSEKADTSNDPVKQEVDRLSMENPDFFNGPGMSYKEINRIDTAKAKIDAYVEQDTKEQQEIIDEMNAISMGTVVSLQEKKEKILELHRMGAQQELNLIREFNEEKLDRYNWAMDICEGKTTVDEILEGKSQDEQNNIIMVMLNSSETLCNQ